MRYYLFFLLILTFLSCREEITLDLPQAEEKLVVEGVIEPGFPPYIRLSKNQGYFDPISEESLASILVNDANVKVWYYNDIGDPEIKYLEKFEIFDNELAEYTSIYTVSLDDYNWLSKDRRNLDDNFYEFSQEGRIYYLEIQWNDKTITAETRIPQSTPLDCLWVQQSETADKDFKCDIRAIYSDPAGEQNNVLVQSKRIEHWKRKTDGSGDSCNLENKNELMFKLIDAGSDILIDGESFETYFPRPKEGGFPTGSYNSYHTKECDDGYILEFPADVVLIKFCQIDEPSMKFWRGLVRQAGSNGNPFSEPKNLVSNINGGLGIWTGYSPAYYKVPIIKDTTIFEEYSPDKLEIF